MAEQASSAYLLMRAKDGRKRPSRTTVPVCKGELIQEFPQPLPADQHSGEHNFHVLNDPSITLWCDPADVVPLAESECHYLLAVSLGHRIKEFHNRDKKEYVMGLKTGDKVSFKTNEGRLVKGKIQYVRPVEENMGVYLGVEIDEDDEYRGQGTTSGYPYFQCGRNNAVWVSMDMVIYPPSPPTTTATNTTTTSTTTTTTVRRAPHFNKATSKPSSDSGQQAPHKHTPAHKPSPETDQYVPVHLRHNDNAEPHDTRAKKIVSRAWKYLAQDKEQLQHSKFFKEGDHVVVYSLKDQRPITATVRWIEMMRMSQEGQVPKVMFAGLETDTKINPDEDFPQLHLVLNGPRYDFQVKYESTKIYLPETLLVSGHDYSMHQQKHQDVKKSDNGINVLEQEILGNTNTQLKAKNIQHQAEEDKVRTRGNQLLPDFDLSAVSTSMIDEQRAELERLEKERITKSERHEQPYNVSAQNVVPHDTALRDAIVPMVSQDNTASKRASKEAVPASCSYPPGHRKLAVGGYHKYEGIQEHAGYPRPVPRRYGTDRQQQQLKDEIPSWLKMDTVVAVRNAHSPDPVTGAVKFIGHVEGWDELVAGLELDVAMEGCTDGVFRGKRYFLCILGKGYFCRIDDLQPLSAIHHSTNAANKTPRANADIGRDPLHQVLQSKLEEKEDEIIRLQKENATLQQQITLLQESNTHLHKTNTHQTSDLSHFQRENSCLQEEVRQLQSRGEQQPKLGSDSDINFWLVSHTEVRLTDQFLGVGAYGSVAVGNFRGQMVAVKQLHSAIQSSYHDRLFRREISLMAKIRHPNLLLFIAAALDTPSCNPMIVLELLDTDLRKAYQNNQLANNRVRLFILRDVAAALNYLHLQREPIIHRDVSSANVLLQALPDNWWRGKLSDFGCANIVQYASTPGPGNRQYMAPEVLKGSQTTKMDVYSYGILFCEILTSQFPDPDVFPFMLQTMAEKWPPMHKVAIECVDNDPTNRPTMSSVVEQFRTFPR